jgi:hypothetical protein
VTLSYNHVVRSIALAVGLLAVFLGTASAATAAVRTVAPVGSDSGDCTVVPCRSMGYAYNRAAAGDTILVAPGQYGEQTVPDGTKAVTLQAAPGATFSALRNHAANVVYDGFDVDVGRAKDLGFHNSGADNVTFRNGRIGNITDEKGALITGRNFTFDNVIFHDVYVSDDEVHNECVYALDVTGMTVRNSHFYNCATMDLFFTYGTWWNPKPPDYTDVTIENNIFEHSTRPNPAEWHYYSLYVGLTGDGGGPLTNWVVRYNTFEIPAQVDGDRPSVSGSRWVGNLGSWNCVSGVTYSYNVGKRCGGTDKQVNPASSSRTSVAPFGWTNPLGHDYTLKAGSPAIDAGDPADTPGTDRRGWARDGRPDAGAYEFGAVGPPGPVTGNPGGGGGPAGGLAIRRARLKPRTICVVPRRGCPGKSKLRVSVSAGARVTVRVLRVRGGRKPRRVRGFAYDVAQKRTHGLRARGLARGRYRVKVFARTADGQRAKPRTLKLRVR